MSKLAKQRGQALTPRFVNNGHGTAEITYSTACACHEVPACSRDAVCSSPVWASPWEPRLLCTGTTLEQHRNHVTWGHAMALLWLRYGHVVAAASAAAPAKGEQMCLRFLRLLKPPSCIAGWVLPSLGSANTVDSANSEATGIMKRTSSAMM